jgi:hypothetical protein
MSGLAISLVIVCAAVLFLVYVLTNWRMHSSSRKRGEKQLLSQLYALPDDAKKLLIHFNINGSQTLMFANFNVQVPLLKELGIVTFKNPGKRNRLVLRPDVWKVLHQWARTDPDYKVLVAVVRADMSGQPTAE